jgi:hypothetical protein
LQQLSNRLDRLAASKAVPRPSGRSDRIFRHGAVQAAVFRVLGGAKGPMRPCEVHEAVVDLLGQMVSTSSVKDCLARNASGPDAQIVRLKRGRYVLSA